MKIFKNQEFHAVLKYLVNKNAYIDTAKQSHYIGRIDYFDGNFIMAKYKNLRIFMMCNDVFFACEDSFDKISNSMDWILKENTLRKIIKKGTFTEKMDPIIEFIIQEINDGNYDEGFGAKKEIKFRGNKVFAI